MSPEMIAQPITRKVAQFKAKTMAEIYPQTPESIRRAKADQEQQRIDFQNINGLAHMLAMYCEAIPKDRPRVLYQMPELVADQLREIASDALQQLKDLDADFRAAFMNEARRG